MRRLLALGALAALGAAGCMTHWVIVPTSSSDTMACARICHSLGDQCTGAGCDRERGRCLLGCPGVKESHDAQSCAEAAAQVGVAGHYTCRSYRE